MSGCVAMADIIADKNSLSSNRIGLFVIVTLLFELVILIVLDFLVHGKSMYRRHTNLSHHSGCRIYRDTDLLPNLMAQFCAMTSSRDIHIYSIFQNIKFNAN